MGAEQCAKLGSKEKVTIIYELELLAAVLALSLWSGSQGDEFLVHFGDNDGVRFSLVKASAAGTIAQKLMAYHLKLALCGSRTWFARDPTECNLSDYPSRGVAHGLLLDCCNVTMKAMEAFVKVLEFLHSGDEALEVGEECSSPMCKSVRSLQHAFMTVDDAVHAVIE